jgi:hypothetical protein
MRLCEQNTIAMILRDTYQKAAVVLLLLGGSATVFGGGSKEIGRTTENEVNILLSSSFGSVSISRGEPDVIFRAEPSDEGDHPRINVSYTVRNRVGYLEISLGEDAGDVEDHWGAHEGPWNITFCDAIPLSFDIELGVGKGEFDLSGLQVKDFTLSSGASEVTVDFDEENNSLIERMSIETGVSKFTGNNLGNANFRQFRFEGGVGSYYLDFGGNLSREADIDIEVGLGMLTLVVPQSVGARLSYDQSWVSRLDCDKGFRLVNEGEYETDNYTDASGKLNIRVESGLGSVKIKRE